MRIYVKKTDNSIENSTVADLKERLSGNNAIVALIVRAGSSAPAEYLLQSVNNELRAYPIITRSDTKFVARVYHTYLDKDKIFSTTPYQAEGESPVIPKGTRYFSQEEKTKLLEEIKSAVNLPPEEKANCPYMEEGSTPLSKTQQEKLYFSMVTPTPGGLAFFDYIKNNILTLEHPEKVLAASISKNPAELSEDEESELRAFRYEFFAPNRIAAFSEMLYKNMSYHPSVGDILDFYIHCVQAELKKLDKDPVSSDEVRIYTDKTRAVKLGDAKYDFKDDGIFNPQGMTEREDAIFRCVMLIMGLQKQFATDDAIIESILKQEQFLPYKSHIRAVILAIINAIEKNESLPMSDIYQPIYFHITAAYPESNEWRLFESKLRMANTALLKMTPLNELILHDTRITEDQKSAILSKIASMGITDPRFLDSLILLELDNIFTQDNFDAIKDHEKPLRAAEALKELHKENIVLDKNIVAVIKDHEKPWGVAELLSQLHKANIVLDENIIAAIQDHKDPLGLALVFTELREANFVLDKNIFAAIKDHKKPLGLANAVRRLRGADFVLDENIVAAIKDHEKPLRAAEALIELHMANIVLDNNIFAAIQDHEDPLWLAKVLNELHKANIILDENIIATIQDHKNTWDLAQALGGLREANILLDNNIFAAIKDHKDPLGVAEALKELHTANIILDENIISAIRDHKDPFGVAQAIAKLHGENIVLHENIFRAIQLSCVPYTLAAEFIKLHKAGIHLDDNIITAIKDSQCRDKLADVFVELHNAGILNARTVDGVVATSNALSKTNSQSQFFATMPKSNLLLEYLKRVYKENGGGWFAAKSIFDGNPEPTCAEIVKKLKTRALAAKKNGKRSASIKTLEEIESQPLLANQADNQNPRAK